ncbi:MAG: flagellar protein FliT [Selenomonadaceae bacterium]|nr:flagellar protein FliT [Selenomonadaceae bacterium]
MLWNKYFLLTQELLKFIDKQDIDTFVDIVSQRDRLIEKMKSLPKNDFRETDECKNLIENIKPMDMQIMYKARTWLNKSRRQNSAVKSYDLTGVAGNLGTSGRIFNRKY